MVDAVRELMGCMPSTQKAAMLARRDTECITSEVTPPSPPTYENGAHVAARLSPAPGAKGGCERYLLHADAGTPLWQVEHVRQSFAWDCGIACVMMILRGRGVRCTAVRMRPPQLPPAFRCVEGSWGPACPS